MGTGVAVDADDTITHTKMNLKLETIEAADIVAGTGIASVPMKFNTFVCPAPGTDWTPQLEGVKLAANKSAKKFWIPLSGLKVGDIITSYNIVGDVVKVAGDTVTFDCKLVMVNKADPITTTDITNGGITQVTADGNFDSAANCDDTTIATDKSYVLECLGTTSNVSTTEQIIVTHAEVTITRLLKPV
jgi:hypothetical protein